MMNTDFDHLCSVVGRRHSCRAFRPDPLTREQITRILQVTRQTASWCNSQPWHIHIVSGAPLEALRSELVARARSGAAPAPELDWPTYTGSYADRRRECGWSLYRAVGIEKGDREASGRQALENFRLFRAPHLAILAAPVSLGTHGVMDCGAWVSNFSLACVALGLGVIAQAAVASWPDILRAHLRIPDGHRVVCGISFGYEDVEHPANAFRTTRVALDEFVQWVG